MTEGHRLRVLRWLGEGAAASRRPRSAIERMAELGVTVGCGDGSEFCPDADTIRGQMATFLHRAETRDAPTD